MKKTKKVKKLDQEAMAEAEMKEMEKKINSMDLKEDYEVPQPSKILKVWDLGNGAIAVLKSEDELLYMNTNLKFPISL